MTAIPGYVPLSDYDHRCRDKSSGHTNEWKSLRAAIRTKEVHGLQDSSSGRWLVHKQQADDFLEKMRIEPPKRRRAEEPQQESVALLRIAAALESIAVSLASRQSEAEAYHCES